MISKLENLTDINLAILDALALPMLPTKAKRTRAARLADLYELQARLFRAAQLEAGDQIPQIYINAAGIAAKRADDQNRFFRNQAGAR